VDADDARAGGGRRPRGVRPGVRAAPAGIRGEPRAAAALARIAATLFITRGDRSGTHVKELEIWKKAGVTPAGDWYVTWERGAWGNAPTTRHADERGAYVLMDRATVLTLRKEIRLQILVENDPHLLNYIAILVNPARLPKVNAADARRFADSLVAEDAQRLVKDFRVERHGAPLFFPNSEEWRRKHPR
jgi:tungstate transport system substrate-binding protein